MSEKTVDIQSCCSKPLYKSQESLSLETKCKDWLKTFTLYDDLLYSKSYQSQVSTNEYMFCSFSVDSS